MTKTSDKKIADIMTAADEIIQKPAKEWNVEEANAVKIAFETLLEESRAASKQYRKLAEDIRDRKQQPAHAAAKLDALIVEDDIKATKRRAYLKAMSDYLGLLD